MRPKSSIGDTGLDAIQSLRKAYDASKEGHRSIPVYEDFNKIEYSYRKSTGQIETITFTYDDAAEKSQVTFNDDVAGSLDGQSWSIKSAKNEMSYVVIYSVDGGTPRPPDFDQTCHIFVEIASNDKAELITKATQLAFEANTNAIDDFIITNDRNSLIITNTIKGETEDIRDSGTGFTFEVLTQGSNVTTEVLTYEYNVSNMLISITNTSNENLLNAFDLVSGAFQLEGNGNLVGVTANGELRVTLTPGQSDDLSGILTQLKIMNVHLGKMTDEKITDLDTDL